MNLFLLHFSSSGSYAPQKKCEHAWFKSVKQWFFFDHLQQPSNERIDPRRGKKWLNKNPGQTLPPGGEGPGVWEFDRFFFLCIWSPVFFFSLLPLSLFLLAAGLTLDTYWTTTHKTTAVFSEAQQFECFFFFYNFLLIRIKTTKPQK